jgi:hypothetical protein
MLGPGDLTHLVCDLNGNHFSPDRAPAARRGFPGLYPGRTTSTRGRVPYGRRDEDVDLRSVVDPAVLVAINAREPIKDVRSGPNVEDGVGVLGWTVRRESTLGAVQVHHLPPDQTPGTSEAGGELEQRAPGPLLSNRHQRLRQARS